MKENVEKIVKIDTWAFLRKTKKPIWIDGIIMGINLDGNPTEYIQFIERNTKLEEIVVDGLGDSQYYQELVKLVEKCPDYIKIRNIDNHNGIFTASKEEFLEGEKKINQIISEINPEWTNLQKAAYVHYKMGSIVSYYPEAMKNGGDGINQGAKRDQECRSIWKALSTGKTLCAGVTYIQRTIFSRLNINTRELESDTHSFLLVETERGNIITDATHDLRNTLFQAKPEFFGVTYEQLREREKGKSNAHKLKEIPENVIGLSRTEQGDVFKSIGMINENGEYKFPLYRMCLQDIKKQDFKSSEEKVEWLFNIFSKNFPRETLHLSETQMLMLSFLVYLLNFPNDILKTEFVYDKNDKKSENPQLTFYIADGKLKEKIFILNHGGPEEIHFDAMTLEDFDDKYTLHRKDVQAGKIPFWVGLIREEQTQNSIDNRHEKVDVQKD